ncbi:MAG: carbon-nitrogen hydrolase family protein [bacterium]|nr:carbon-nitrogen hydrolase family protein [bacterium]
MKSETIRVALITEVFFDNEDRLLKSCLKEAKGQGAELAVLPELPLNPWSPATKSPRKDDEEQPGGWRQTMFGEAAAEVEIAVLGGAIQADPEFNNRRFNTALLFDASGSLIGSYRKTHLPEETGYWETSHYEPADEPPRVMTGLPISLGVQICSDANRPQGTHLLSAQGADVVFNPRATPVETYERWNLVLRANAVTSACYVISVNRPRPEFDVDIGGPSLAIAPDGEVLLETTDQVAVVTIERERLEKAKANYPGYLPERAQFWVEGWSELVED